MNIGVAEQGYTCQHWVGRICGVGELTTCGVEDLQEWPKIHSRACSRGRRDSSRRLQTAGECGTDLLLKTDRKRNYHRPARRVGISDYVTGCCCWRRDVACLGGLWRRVPLLGLVPLPGS